jgi:hypothetical protein
VVREISSANDGPSQAEYCLSVLSLDPAVTHIEGFQIPNPLPTLQLAQKLEHVAACLRHNDVCLLAPEDLFLLTENIDTILGRFNPSRSSLLQQRVPNIPPNVKGWTETKAIM